MSDLENKPPVPKLDFIRQAITDDLAEGRTTYVATRFPPEPSGYLHLGHVKAVWANYQISQDFGGLFHLRMDDTNPIKEEAEFIQAIQDDLHWLGIDWGDRFHCASDYFEQMHGWALDLVEKGLAYVDDLSADEIRTYRGTFVEPGKDSPFRQRTVEENLDLFQRMKAGEFPDGHCVLRAKIDMADANINLRDPIMYRIVHATHPHRGDDWCIYPMYDWAHGLEDSIEGITYSLCDVSFEHHRPLYDWFIQSINQDRPEPIHVPRQIEFARYNLENTVLSKRKLRRLVEAGVVTGWDDPRLPTIRGMRRRGYTPETLRDFSLQTGISKYPAVFEMALLDSILRKDLNARCDRVMGVLNPLKVVITNWPEGKVDELEAINNPEDPSAGTRIVPFTRELYIEREDFMEDAPKKFFRLAPGKEVRLRYAYFITCDEVIKDDAGEVIELRCSCDLATRGGDSPDGRKVKGTLHWVSADKAVDVEVRLYDRLFTMGNPEADLPEGGDFLDNVNPNSLTVLPAAKLEPSVQGKTDGWQCQFERLGYFRVDADTTDQKLVFNRTVTLRDSWAKKKKK